MRALHLFRAGALRFGLCLFVLATPHAALAQDPVALQELRQQYDALMADFERLAALRGETVLQAEARRGREAMQTLSDADLAEIYARTRVPDLTAATMASQFVVRRAEAWARADAGGPATAMSPGFPGPVGVPGGCNGVDISGDTRFGLLVAKEVTASILAAATFVCNTSILGVNTSLVCVPFSIAASIAAGLFDTATFCAGEVTANQIDANFNRLAHLHGDLEGAIMTIVNTSNANTTAIINNDNANTTAIIGNNNTNTAAIVANDNANTAAIITNATANKNELRDLILRSQIEADLAMADSAAVVALFELPGANGGYLELVGALVTETIADVLAAGGSVSNAQAFLDSANAARAAGDFKTAYGLYRKAYKAAGR